MEIELGYLAKLTGGKVENVSEKIQVKGFSSDSRKIVKNNMFVALKGQKTDGHLYVAQALKNGAAAVLCEKKIDGPIVLVPDCIKAIGVLASAKITLSGAKVIGVTGSVGKTTTKEAVRSVFSTGFKVTASEGNMNTEIGMPLTILNADSEADYFVLEMGARKKHDIKNLCSIAKPDIAIITRIAPVHLEIFGSLDSIADSKFEIVENLKENGKAFVNGDDEEITKRIDEYGAKIQYFGVRHQKVTNIRRGKTKTNFIAENIEFCVRSPGESGLYAALAALKTGLFCGLEAREISRGISEMKLPPNRLDVFRSRGITVIDDSYNSSPVALESAMKYVANFFDGRKLAVIGDMKELGKESPFFHEKAGSYAVKLGFSEIIAVGEYSGFILKGAKENSSKSVICREADDWRQALQTLIDDVREGDVVLIKGSRAMELDNIADTLKSGGRNV